MDHWDLEFEQTLAESEALLKNTARSLDEDADYSLDSILAEFGGSLPSRPKPRRNPGSRRCWRMRRRTRLLPPTVRTRRRAPPLA